MAPRRLRMVCSSDEHDEPQHHQQPPQVEEYDDDDVEIELQEPTLNLETTENKNGAKTASNGLFLRRRRGTTAPPPTTTNRILRRRYIDMELQEPTLNLETVTINSSNPNQNPNSNPCGAIQLEISNDDFIDVPENLSPLPPPAPRRDWLDSCILCLEILVPGFVRFDNVTKAKLCFKQFLYSDMNYTGVLGCFQKTAGFNFQVILLKCRRIGWEEDTVHTKSGQQSFLAFCYATRKRAMDSFRSQMHTTHNPVPELRTPPGSPPLLPKPALTSSLPYLPLSYVFLCSQNQCLEETLQPLHMYV
ncbi:unnamed protein product [Ilex paraguariensis]|uniref:Uncharacterized protein n=1 Tax=Ilex paraguariensis TaxID=185542 RepID=A0ABC8UQF7_9AQUA